jgi:16S rRNA pseudouridine516 synthase
MKLVKLLANLGYGSRKDVMAMFREGRVTDAAGEVLYADDKVPFDAIRIDGEPLDPPAGMALMLHKPVGYTCSTKDPGRVIYDLLPPRFRLRSPLLSSVGRLDRDTSGLLLMTDDGTLLHRIVSPKARLAKVYEATLANDLRGDEAEVFASGTLMLESETTPLAPAQLHATDPRHAAVGNHVVALHRSRIGGLELGDLPAGQWRLLDEADLQRLFGTTEPA